MIDVVARTDANADIAYTGNATGTVEGYTITPTTPVTLGTASTTPEFAAVNHKVNDVLMLLPQTTTGKVKFTIVLGYKDTANADKTAEAYFITTAEQTWAPNKIYLYKFEINMPQVLNQKPIEFGEPTIADWDNTPTEVTPGQQ